MTTGLKAALFAACAAAVFAAVAPASAGQVVTEPENRSCGNPAARDAVAKIESKGSGDLRAVNSWGYVGRYQVGEAKLLDLGLVNPDGNSKDNKYSWSSKAASKYGIRSTEDFLSSEAAQEAIQDEIDALNVKYLGSAMNNVGKPLSCGGTVSKEALVAASQLGAGKVRNYFNNGGRCVGGGDATSTIDGNGTCVEKYLCAVSGCKTIEKDMSKRTCEATMPMIEAIDCSNFPGSVSGFCRQYRPYLMTRAECSDAEAMAQAAPKGPNAEKCENLSFGVGTGSWSFVLACSWAADAVADQDGESNPSGPVSDPECISRLKGMGVEFNTLGRVQNGSYNGTTCFIDNAVSLSGTAIPYGATLTMTCDMAVAMEQFGQKMKGIGATGYYSIGSTRPCGPMRDKNGDKPGTITEHALGRAVDLTGFIAGGRKISFGKIHEPGTPDGQLALQAKSIACSTFRGVLSPSYSGYTGKYIHNHLEWGRFSGCR